MPPDSKNIVWKISDKLGREIILQKGTVKGHIMYGHIDGVIFTETAAEAVKDPDLFFQDSHGGFHYIKEVNKAIRIFFFEEEKFLEVCVKKMFDDEKKEFWGVATLFPVSEDMLRKRSKTWKKI